MAKHKPADHDSQADVIHFLMTDGLGRERPERIDTHAGMVFLSGNRAWKMKRAVKFDYLDFTTPEKRRTDLEDELRLNRRTAPGLYLKVHPITRDTSGRLALDGGGKTVDWILEMQRFADDARLDRYLQKNAARPNDFIRLASQIQAFHAGAEIAPSQGQASAFGKVIDGNAASMRRFPQLLDDAAVNHLARLHHMHCERLSGLMDERARIGRVRHGHGDLHMANIAIIEDEPTLFDCLEFDPRLATVDVLYDLAFLLMDLWHHGFEAEANIVMNRYLDLSPDDEAGIALLPLFLSVRAAIRAHVMAAQAEGGGNTAIGAEANAYLRLAQTFMATVHPRLVAVGGLSGTGKSTLARSVAHLLGAPPGARVLRSDVLRKRMAGLPPETTLRPEQYTPRSHIEVYRLLRRLAADTLACQCAVITDAVFAQAGERTAMEAVALEADAAFDGLWMSASDATRLARVKPRTNDASDAGPEVALAQSRYDTGNPGGWHRIDADGELAGTIRAALLALRLQPDAAR